jgi:carbon-monoxide dehydrogenase medium subunit
VKPAPFEYHAPRTVDEAVAVLGEVGHDGKVLAGGQSLVPILNMRLASPPHQGGVHPVGGLDAVTGTDTEVRGGALVRQASVEHHDEAYAALPLLRQALTFVAHPVIRNRGTVVGSLAHADPSAELPAVLVLTGGVVEVVGGRGAREVAAADFFIGPLETAIAPDELAVAVRFPTFAAGTGTAFLERSRRHGDYALAGAAAAVSVADGVVRSARVSLVSVTDVPDVLDLSAVFEGREPAGVDWSTADNLVRQHIDPISDIQATAEYRSALACELAHRALAAAAAAQAADRAQGIHPNGLLPADRAQGIHPNGELPAGGGA